MLLCAALSVATWAATTSQIRNSAEASMLVTGWIEVMPDGSVHDYSIEHPEKIPPAVLDLIKQNVPTWKFTLDGNANVIERARMNVRIVAKRVDDTHDSLSIVGATFGEGGDKSDEYVSRKSVTIPRYPQGAINARVDGTVYLFVRVGRQGQVEDVVAEQVNLGEYGNEHEMQRYRKLLADAAMDAIKAWTFNTPTTGKHVADAFWNVRVPVNFNLQVRGAPVQDTYGKWEGYIPGPRQPIPWMEVSKLPAVSADAIPDGSLGQANPDISLTTPLSPGA
jgi:hypothetical protein